MTPTGNTDTHPDVIQGEVVGNADAVLGGDLELYDRSLFPDLLSQEPDEVNARFARRFMAAESIEDLFDVMEGKLAQSLIGRRLTIEQVAWAPYESDRGVIPLAIVQSTDVETSEALEFATTSMALTMFLRRAQIIEALPFHAKITSTKTRSGQTALNFARA